MSQQHRPKLLTVAQKEYESLLYDLAQATAVIPLQQCTLRLAKILQMLLHDHLLDQNEVMQGRSANPEAADKSPVPAPSLAPQPPHTTPADSLPSLGNDPRSLAPGNSVMIPGMPPVDIDPNVTNVVVTPQGSRVVGGPATPPASSVPADPNALPTLT